MKLDPPKPTVDWERVSHYNFLEDFHLLRDTRNSVMDKPWTRPAIRETMKQARRIERAQEEIERCNVEARRLHTSIRDEEAHFLDVLARLKAEQSRVYGAVAEYCERRRNINARHLDQLEKLYKLKGFTGIPYPGTHNHAAAVGVRVFPADVINRGDDRPATECTSILTGGILDAEDAEADAINDEGEVEMGALVDFVSNLAM